MQSPEEQQQKAFVLLMPPLASILSVRALHTRRNWDSVIYFVSSLGKYQPPTLCNMPHSKFLACFSQVNRCIYVELKNVVLRLHLETKMPPSSLSQ